ncbi:MAG: hypothetical protein ACRCTP_02370 [Aeromonas popoffii]|uniref:hypothetical protein n=1 Tax=Aeromonas popoffii TaxID=70856 RepID=UPI003F2CF1F1
MIRIGFLSNAASDGMSNITTAIGARNERNLRALRIARERSVFKGRADDLIVNWGRGSGNDYLEARVGLGGLLNKTQNVALATNKLKSFQAMDGEVSTVEWTADREQAQVWIDAGLPVYARTKLQGHSGEGIVVCSREALGDVGGIETSVGLVEAKLYTKGFNNQRREFRIHVMNGVPTFVQQKKRRENWRDNALYSNVVRNFHTGWVYAAMDIHPNDKSLAEAVKAVTAHGLDFGAVDVITRGDDAWVLEVNTAPGNEGTNTEYYADNFVRIARGEDPVHYTQRVREVAPAAEEAADENFALEAEPVVAPVAPAPRVRPRPVEEVAAAVPAADRGQVNNIQPVDKKFYFLEINGEETVGQWSRQLSGFMVVGFAMSIPKNEVTIKREVA